MRPFEPEARADSDQAAVSGVSETLASLWNWAAAVREAEMRRLENRVPGLRAGARNEVDRAIQRVVEGLFGDLGARLSRDAALIDAVHVLFALDTPGGKP
ncbi:hypothetical protein [Nocardia niwae]|uniref:hypothetical protein n=1 Tax=Nocardia niwae TaxID=626084 RepID=UPI000A49BF86|nr:hypothetical protein [Nocardia niwae]